MPLLIGVDEAGYGPNFGPLVIAATGWLVPTGVTHDGLAESLSAWITDTRPFDNDGRIYLADSKRVYRGGQGFAELESGVLSMMSVAEPLKNRGGSSSRVSVPTVEECLPATLRDLWQRYDSTYGLDAGRVPWVTGFPVSLPVDTSRELLPFTLNFWNGWSRQTVRYLGARLAVVAARRFNSLLARHGRKSNVLTVATLRLVRRCLQDWLPLDPMADIVCDKHGGRHHYAAMLQDRQTDALVVVRQETRPVSHYTWRTDSGDIHWRFVMKSERWLPAALASMTAKYVRELSMIAFNAYWAQQVPGIRPTAGYPTDARRFRRDIAAAQHRLGLPDRWLWRSR